MKRTVFMKTIIRLDLQHMSARFQITDNDGKRRIGIVMMSDLMSVQINRCGMAHTFTLDPYISLCLKSFTINPLSSVICKKRMVLPAARHSNRKLLSCIVSCTWFKFP